MSDEPIAAPAAVAAPKAKPAPIPEGFVRVRVTKFGHDKIFTGETKSTVIEGAEVFDKNKSFPRHQKDDMPVFPLSVAEAQEALGNVEIQD